MFGKYKLVIQLSDSQNGQVFCFFFRKQKKTPIVRDVSNIA